MCSRRLGFCFFDKPDLFHLSRSIGASSRNGNGYIWRKADIPFPCVCFTRQTRGWYHDCASGLEFTSANTISSLLFDIAGFHRVEFASSEWPIPHAPKSKNECAAPGGKKSKTNTPGRKNENEYGGRGVPEFLRILTSKIKRLWRWSGLAPYLEKRCATSTPALPNLRRAHGGAMRSGATARAPKSADWQSPACHR